ncbi:hypothetical protein [Paenibacillus sp. HJGM_3]|uniref:hypothetical protein n=1 Tax=Paenibacillus sp. HJGM_3 TaxID=3379816 RepID=UPI0038598DB6
MHPKKLKLLYVPVLLGGAIWLGTTIISNAADGGTTSSTQPGSVDDPVITKSYFDQQINQKVAEAITKQPATDAAIQQAVAAEIAKLKQELAAGGLGSGTGSPGTGSGTGTTPGTGTSVDGQLQVVQLPPGKTIYAGVGAELIVRTGKTIAVSNDDNGIPDVTAGKDIPAGAAVENNHLLIFPREGRGVKPDPKNVGDIYIMVRGGYIIP